MQKRHGHVVNIVLQKFVRAKKGGDTEIAVPKTGVSQNIGLVQDDVWGQRLGEGVWLPRVVRRCLIGGMRVQACHVGLLALGDGFIDLHVVLHGYSFHVIHVGLAGGSFWRGEGLRGFPTLALEVGQPRCMLTAISSGLAKCNEAWGWLLGETLETWCITRTECIFARLLLGTTISDGGKEVRSVVRKSGWHRATI